jgi:hypothetical protein
MKRLELLVETSDLAGKRFSVGPAGLRLGRSSSSDIHVADEELSRNHCLFEISGETGIRITDLASANGTCVNGVQLGSETLELKAGDVITAGSLLIRVVGDEPPSSKPVDLGLGAAQTGDAGKDEEPGEKKRSPLMNAIWIGVAALLVLATYMVLTGVGESQDLASVSRSSNAEASDHVVEMRYEKVSAGSESIFRYFMSLAPDGTLRVVIDDVPGENRHNDRSKRLDEKARKLIDDILLDPGLLAMERQYVGPEGDPPQLHSWTLDVIYADSIRSFSIVNTQEPDAFRRIREKLEAFAKNEFGIWAIQRSSADLIKSAAEIAEAGRMKWEERDVEHGNVDAAIRAYREALVYLDTVNPKPPEYDGYREALEAAEKEQESRYREQRFRADRALNLSDWETAKAELQILCQMVPDRNDDRNREALAKLNDVEKRIRGGK